MPALLEDCQELFDTSDLYEVLKINKGASENEVKRGYHKLSLKVHPDRVTEDGKEEATRKFQTLGKVYSILSDQERRKIYDETGEVDDESDTPQDRDWSEYWRLLFAKVSVKDIEEFEKKYKGSDEELNDLQAAYLDYKGNMDEIMDNVLCASIEDEGRFRDILSGLIKEKKLPKYKAFTKEKASKAAQRKKKAAEEAAEAEEYKKELGINEEDSLRSLILKRGQSREAQMDDFFSQLEQKYAKPKSKKKK